MAWLHGWCGVVAGWVLYVVFVTGSFSYFDLEISQWMRPELSQARMHPDAVALALRLLEERAPDSPRWLIKTPQPRRPTLQIGWSIAPEPGKPASLLRRFESLEVNPFDGEELRARSTRGGDFFRHFHSELNLEPTWGRWIVGGCAMFMLVGISSGVITHRNLLRNLFTFRPGKGPRPWREAHNIAGVLALPYHIMITYTGLVTMMLMYMPAAVEANYRFDAGAFLAELFPNPTQGEASGQRATLAAIEPLLREAARRWNGELPASLNIEYPNDAAARIHMQRGEVGRVSTNAQSIIFDGISGEVLSVTAGEAGATRTHGVLKGLHLAHFSPIMLRWLFAVCGLAGAAMVATGLMLWSAKRSPTARSATPVSLNYRVLRVVNLGTIAGLWIGIDAYFMANRLLAVDLAERSTWEVRCFFIGWAASYVAAAVQNRRWAWSTQFGIGALLFASLPLVNSLTTSTHLGNSLPHGWWTYAGFDLAMLAIAALLGIAAWHAAPTVD